MNATHTEQVLPLNGIDLHVTRAGQGEPLLMLHGVTVDATFGERELDALAERYAVIAPDLRGHGRSTRPASFTIADHVGDLLALLDALDLRRVHVLGASMGSYLAQALTLAAPERVEKLVLVVARSNGRTTSSDRILADHAEELHGLSREEQQQWLAVRMFAPHTPAAARQAVGDWMTSRAELGLALTAEQLAAANDALRGFDFRDRLPGVNIPTLVISGRHDILNPPEEGAELARLLPDARLEIFEDSGHLLSWEEPDHYVRVVRDFLSE